MLGVFLWQGALLGFVGATFGVMLGALFTRFLAGVVLFSIEVSYGLVASAFAISLLTGVLAAILPARKAARMDPAAAIRGDA